MNLPISPFMDRENPTPLPKTQTSFIDFVVQPLYSHLKTLLPASTGAERERERQRGGQRDREEEERDRDTQRDTVKEISNLFSLFRDSANEPPAVAEHLRPPRGTIRR